MPPSRRIRSCSGRCGVAAATSAIVTKIRTCTTSSWVRLCSADAIFYPGEQGAQVMNRLARAARKHAGRAYDQQSFSLPPLRRRRSFPRTGITRKWPVVVACWSGNAADGEEVVRPLRDSRNPDRRPARPHSVRRSSATRRPSLGGRRGELLHLSLPRPATRRGHRDPRRHVTEPLGRPASASRAPHPSPRWSGSPSSAEVARHSPTAAPHSSSTALARSVGPWQIFSKHLAWAAGSPKRNGNLRKWPKCM